MSTKGSVRQIQINPTSSYFVLGDTSLSKKRRFKGFTLYEVLIAMTILMFTLLGLVLMFPICLRLNAQQLTAVRCVQLGQRELEQIRQSAFAPTGSFTDDRGNVLDVGCDELPGTSCGNPLDSEGKIDFALPPAVGYSVELPDAAGQVISIRWNITVTASGGRKIALGVQPVGGPGGIRRPVHLQTLVSR